MKSDEIGVSEQIGERKRENQNQRENDRAEEWEGGKGADISDQLVGRGFFIHTECFRQKVTQNL